jgi:excisionase family DNA binding protein
MDRPRPLLVAPVSGFPALVLSQLLDAEGPGRMVSLQRLVEEGRLDPGQVAAFRSTWAAIRAAGKEWAEWRSAADGSAAEQLTAIPAESTREIDSAEAARQLGVTPNRVRQLARCGQINARKSGRQWLVDRKDVGLRKALGDGQLR